MNASVKDPIRIGGHLVKNRVTFAPTVKFNWAGEDGIPTDRFALHYALRAQKECGLICVEATCVSPDGRLAPSQLGLWSDKQIPGHRKITDSVHAYGSTIIVQIHHGGYHTHPECGPAKSASSVPCRNGISIELSVDEIHKIQQEFISAAYRAKQAGYDGIQLHGCHQYLINQFLSSESNHRTDCYGGSLENRVRFTCEILRGIRDICGADFIISVRTPGAEPDVETAVTAAKLYVEAGCNYIQVSDGISMEYQKQHDETLPYSALNGLGVSMHRALNGLVPVSCVGDLSSPEKIRAMIENDLVDTVDLARPLLADPALAQAAIQGTDYIPCFHCKRCLWGPFDTHRCPAALKRKKANPDDPDILA